LAKKISRIDRRFAAYARLKNKKSAGDSTTRQQQRQRQRQRQNNGNNKMIQKISRIAALTLRRKTKRAREKGTTRNGNDNNKISGKLSLFFKREIEK
jgi:hypothetical protein